MSLFKGAYTVWYDMDMDVQGVTMDEWKEKDREIMMSSTNL